MSIYQLLFIILIFVYREDKRAIVWGKILSVRLIFIRELPSNKKKVGEWNIYRYIKCPSESCANKPFRIPTTLVRITVSYRFKAKLTPLLYIFYPYYYRKWRIFLISHFHIVKNKKKNNWFRKASPDLSKENGGHWSYGNQSVVLENKVWLQWCLCFRINLTNIQVISL